MSATYFPYENIYNLVSHHIGRLSRFDLQQNEPFSILYLHLENRNKEEIIRSMEEILRDSDAILYHEDSYFLLLPNTDNRGIETVAQSFSDYYRKVFSNTFVTYPYNGNMTRTLLNNLTKKIKNDYNMEIVFNKEVLY
jgi:hypothetical protein